MKVSHLISRAHTLARLLETPALLKLYRIGGMVPIYEALDKPWFHSLGIKTVLDIGANEGRFAMAMAELLPHSRIYAFEPLPTVYEQLCKNAKLYPAHITPINCALGEQDSQVEFFQFAYQGSSSFLKPNDQFKHAAPEHASTTSITVASKRLDDIAHEVKIQTPLCAKLDVQGFENRVLRGGANTLSKANVIIIESFFQPHYEDQAMFDDVYKTLTSWDFRYFGSLDVQSDKTGLPAWEDALFVKFLPLQP